MRNIWESRKPIKILQLMSTMVSMPVAVLSREYIHKSTTTTSAWLGLRKRTPWSVTKKSRHAWSKTRTQRSDATMDVLKLVE